MSEDGDAFLNPVPSPQDNPLVRQMSKRDWNYGPENQGNPDTTSPALSPMTSSSLEITKAQFEEERKVSTPRQVKELTIRARSSIRERLKNNSSKSRGKSKNSVAPAPQRISTRGSVVSDIPGTTGRNLLEQYLCDEETKVESRFMIHHTSRVLAVWHTMITAGILFSISILPLVVCLRLEVGWWYYTLVIMYDIICIIDVFVYANSTYVDQWGDEVSDRSLVFSAYLSSWFAMDVLTAIPYQLIAFVSNDPQTAYAVSLCGLIKASMVLRWVVTSRSNRPSVTLNVRFAAIMRLVRLILLQLFILHWIACLWFVVVHTTDESMPRWLSTRAIDDEDTWRQYWVCMYTAFLMNFQNDARPVSNGEMMFACLSMLVGALTYALIFGGMAVLIQNMDSATSKFKQKMDALGEAMHYYRVPIDVQKRVHRYHLYKWSRNRGYEGNFFIQDLSPALASVVSLHLHARMLTKVPLFKRCNPGFMNLIATMLRPLTYMEDDVIFREGDPGKEMFFIAKGVVSVYKEKDKNFPELWLRMGDGSFFGEIALLMSDVRTASVTAITFCDLYVLTKEDFDKVLLEYPNEGFKIQEIARNRMKRRLSESQEDRLLVASTLQALDMVQKVPLFQNCSMTFVQSIVSLIQQIECEPGKTLCKKGDIGNRMFFISEGSVEVQDENGRLLCYLTEGSYFGEISLLYSEPRTATVVTTTMCVLNVLWTDDFTPLLEQFPVEAAQIRFIATERKANNEFRDDEFESNTALQLLKTVAQVPFFKDSSHQFMKQIVQCLKELHVNFGDFVFTAGDEGREMYFVMKGTVEVLDIETGAVYATLKEGSYFGEIALLTDSKRMASVRCCTSSACLQVLSADDLNDMMQHFPQEAENFQKVADERILHTTLMKQVPTFKELSESFVRLCLDSLQQIDTEEGQWVSWDANKHKPLIAASPMTPGKAAASDATMMFVLRGVVEYFRPKSFAPSAFFVAGDFFAVRGGRLRTQTDARSYALGTGDVLTIAKSFPTEVTKLQLAANLKLDDQLKFSREDNSPNAPKQARPPPSRASMAPRRSFIVGPSLSHKTLLISTQESEETEQDDDRGSSRGGDGGGGRRDDDGSDLKLLSVNRRMDRIDKALELMMARLDSLIPPPDSQTGSSADSMGAASAGHSPSRARQRLASLEVVASGGGGGDCVVAVPSVLAGVEEEDLEDAENAC